MLTEAGVVLTLLTLGPVWAGLLRVLLGNVVRAVPDKVLRAVLGNEELLELTDEGRLEEAGSGSGAGVSRIF